MPTPQLPAFNPHDVPESNATSYPEPYRAANLHRYNRRLGDHVGLQNYGVVMTRISVDPEAGDRAAVYAGGAGDRKRRCPRITRVLDLTNRRECAC